MTDAHAFLAPSSASIWGPGGCSAFPRMAALYPEDEETLKAREGTAAHHYVTETAIGAVVPVGTLAPNGFPITDEMVEGGAQMIADMQALMATPGVRFTHEQRVDMPTVHPTLNWGRCDFGAVNWVTQTLHVWDFKFGHDYVDVFENWQLVDYAVGLADLFGITLHGDWTVDARIYQPRSFHKDGPVKLWICSGGRFLELVTHLTAAAHAATDPQAPMSTGAYCDFCPANIHCPAFQRVAGKSIDISMHGTPHELTAANAGLLLKTVRTARERLEDMETGLEAQILAALKAGGRSLGWTTEQGYGREKWTQPVADVVALGELLGKNLRKPAEAITPAQARKLGIDDAVISAYSTKPLGEVKLVPVNDKTARKVFQQ